MRREELLRTALCLLGLFLPGCTAYGYGFDDPKGEVSLVGDPFTGCDGGLTFIFGNARNTGDVEVRNVTAFADVFDSGGGFAGRFQSPVSTGVESVEGAEGSVDIVDDSLEVEESGSFNINTTVGCGAVSREEIFFDFTVITFEEL